MASLIKNQILKHLSRFAKNLSPDQINLSTLKGEGELQNLELNEEILTELLDLPCWMILRSATCKKVQIQIQWTKLSSVPILLWIEDLKINLETCEELRNYSTQYNVSLPKAMEYGFLDKVVDGISVTITSVNVNLSSKVFTTSFQVSRIFLESKTPNWSNGDLRLTRLKDVTKGQVLIFKELSVQTIRIEVKSTTTPTDILTPLRLIINQARCRITVKKKLSNCSVLGCRLVLIFDDVSWVFTEDQVKAALHFTDSLSDLLKRATEASQKIKGARKLENSVLVIEEKNESKKKNSIKGDLAAKSFSRYDVIETSYHFYSKHIDLHLMDEPNGNDHSRHPKLENGGAFQISLSGLQIDIYPYHLANHIRDNWIRYNQHSIQQEWINSSLESFQASLLDFFLASKIPFPYLNSNGSQADISFKTAISLQLKKLMTNNIVIRLSNITMWKISTPKDKVSPKQFLTGDQDKLTFNDDMPLIHFEITQFFYPDDSNFPIPCPKLYGFINPIIIIFDPITVLWLNAFVLNIRNSIKSSSSSSLENKVYMDIKIEAIMLRVMIENSENLTSTNHSLHIQVARLLIANYRSLETGSKQDLLRVVSNCSSFECIAKAFNETLLVKNEHSNELKMDLLWNESRNVWSFHLDPLWMDFFESGKGSPLLDAFPLTLWIVEDVENEDNQTLHLLSSLKNLINIQLNHSQLLFFLRIGETLSEISSFMSRDSEYILQDGNLSVSTKILFLIPQIDVSLIFDEKDGESFDSSLELLLKEIKKTPIKEHVKVSTKEEFSSSKEEFESLQCNESDSFIFLPSEPPKNEINFNELFSIHSKPPSPIEIAMELTENDFLEGVDSVKSCNVNECTNLSVLLLHLERNEITLESKGVESCLKLQTYSLSLEEIQSLASKEFQRKFALRSKCWKEKCLQSSTFSTSSWCLKLGFLSSFSSFSIDSSISLREQVAKASEASLELQIQNLPLELKASSALGLASLFTDDTPPILPLPMRIQIQNVSFKILEDNAAPPYEFQIPSLVISRDKSGLFSIMPTLDSLQEDEFRKRNNVLTAENMSLKISLESAILDLCSSKNKFKEKEKELIIRVKVLEEENRSLCEMIQSLQVETNKSSCE